MNTKKLILDAAIEIFATKAYHVATLGEICEQAGANCAAANYHFGSKDALLSEAIRHAFHIAEATYPIDGGLPASAPPEDRLRAFMAAIISRSFDPGPAGYFEKILGRVMASESSRKDETFGEVGRIHHQVLDPILAEMIDFKDEAELAQAETAIIALCVFQNTVPGCRERLFPDGLDTPGLDRYIDSRTRLALAGLGTYNLKKSSCIVSPA
ncbi:TetR/AcrR family transcriptional regulator [Verrucomicrobiales bacterium]|nr:TetR/AcrR family transcriptional regulator [Verrucomicrobiales bacterium]